MADKVFTITEMKRVTSSGGTSSFVPEGARFEWTAGQKSAPQGIWTMPLKLRTSRSDLPGAEEPVEQVLGWNYEPFQLSGVWDDRYMGAGGAFTTFKEFEALCKRGAIVRVEFERVTAYGLLTDFVPGYHRDDMIDYAFTMSPHFRSLGESVRGPAPAPVVDPREAVEAALAGHQNMEDIQAGAGRTASPASKAKLKALVPSVTDKTVPLAPPFQAKDGFLDVVGGYIDDGFSALGDAIGLVQDNVLDPLSDGAGLFARLAGRFAALKSVSFNMLQQLNSASSTTTQAYETAMSTLEFETWARGLSAQARLSWGTAHASQSDLERRAQPLAVALYRPFKGESLYAISQRFYGTPHEWRRISEKNGLTSLTLAGTELLIIPEI